MDINTLDTFISLKKEQSKMFEQARIKGINIDPESIRKLGETLLIAWERIKQVFTEFAKNFLDYIRSKTKPLMKWLEENEKPPTYRQGLHSFLKTKSYHRIDTFNHSNIYYTNGINAKGHKRRN
jgi:hypothetical protein